MNENLNLVEILKDCPKGTRLYSTIFGEVEFGFIEDHSIYPIVLILNGGHEYLTSDGKLFNQFDGECILFPSREQRDWSKFKHTCKFKDGDILSYQNKYLNNRTIYIYRYHKTNNTAFYVALGGNENETFYIDNEGELALNGYDETVCFATEEEKQKLFKAIKDKGYKWNAETKTLEKLVEPKFDPKTLMAFDKVLFRDYSINRAWTCGIFSHANFEFTNPFKVGCCSYKCCIPYNEDTKHLVGSQEEAPEYYRYWED